MQGALREAARLLREASHREHARLVERVAAAIEADS